MRNLVFAISFLLSGFAALAQAPIVRSGWTTNGPTARTAAANALMHWASNGLASGAVFVDALAGDDTTGDGTPTAPVATLTKGQALATNGNTVVAVRGTFNESSIGKEGVSWWFADGVVVTNTALTFGSTNLDGSVQPSSGASYIGGRGTFLGASCLYFYSVTNLSVFVDAKQVAVTTVVTFAARNSNVTARVRADTISGANNWQTAAVTNRSTVIYECDVLTNYTSTATLNYGAHSNNVVFVDAKQWFLGGNQVAKGTRYFVRGGIFDSNGQTVGGGATNRCSYFFQGTTLTRTNDYPGIDCTFGSFHYLP